MSGGRLVRVVASSSWRRMGWRRVGGVTSRRREKKDVTPFVLLVVVEIIEIYLHSLCSYCVCTYKFRCSRLVGWLVGGEERMKLFRPVYVSLGKHVRETIYLANHLKVPNLIFSMFYFFTLSCPALI